MDLQQTQWATSASSREAQLLAMVEELRTQVQELRQQRAPKTRQVLPETDRFTGRTKEWDTWSMTMRAKLRIDGEAIGDNEAQFFYVYSSLNAKVQALVLAFVRATQESREWQPLALIDYLGRIYNNLNKAKKAGQRLIELRQGTTSVTAYIPQFEKVLFEAGAGTWPDDAKITTLVGGLNKYTRQRIDGQLSLPTEYNGFVRMLQTLGNQFGPSYSNDKDNAMEWEPVRAAATKTAPNVSRNQRQEWRDAGKCVRCGSQEHWVKGCKYQATRSRASSTSSRSSMQSKAKIIVSTVQPARTKTTARPSRPLGEPDEPWTYTPTSSGRGGG